MRFYFVISLLFASVAISVGEDSDGESRTQRLGSRYDVASVRYFPTPSPVRSVPYGNPNVIKPDPHSHCTSSLSCDLSELCYRNQCWPKEIMDMPSLPTPSPIRVSNGNRNVIEPNPHSHCTSSLSCHLSELCYRNQCWPKEIMNMPSLPTPSPVRSVPYGNRNVIKPDPHSHCTSSLSCDLSELCYRNQCWPKEIMDMPSLPTPSPIRVSNGNPNVIKPDPHSHCTSSLSCDLSKVCYRSQCWPKEIVDMSSCHLSSDCDVSDICFKGKCLHKTILDD